MAEDDAVVDIILLESVPPYVDTIIESDVVVVDVVTEPDVVLVEVVVPQVIELEVDDTPAVIDIVAEGVAAVDVVAAPGVVLIEVESDVGPQGQPGVDGEPGPPGPAGPAADDVIIADYIYTQSAPALVWNIPHMQGRYSDVLFVNTAGDQMWPTVEYVDLNNIRATFGVPTSGTARVSI